MIKVIALDLVGVLVKEKSGILNETEDKIERCDDVFKKIDNYLKDNEYV